MVAQIGTPIKIGATARYITPLETTTYQTLEDLPERLKALSTVVMYIDPDGNVTHLNGPLAGAEGVTLGMNIQGDRFMPFNQVVTESAWELGATRERANYNKRRINARITIGSNAMSNYQYRMCEDRWWSGFREDAPGWWGEFTRYSGWRWTAVWPLQNCDTAQKMDTTAHGNNIAIYDIDFLAPLPYYSKPATFKVWKASESGQKNADGYYDGVVPLANRGDMTSYVMYLVSGGGVCQLQDNANTGTMVTLPELFDSDGTVLVNTDPTQRTLVSSNDPVDNEYYKLIRASGILNFFLGDLASSGQPVWLRDYVRFVYTVPPKSVVHFKVRHTNPNATITTIVPQRFKRGW